MHRFPARASLAAGFALLAWTCPAHALKTLEPGEAVPAVSVHDAELKPHPLTELLAPKGALLVFWASWNPRSTQILSYLGRLQEKYGDKGMSVVPINVDHEAMEKAQVETVAAAFGALGLPWATYYDLKLDAFSSLGIITIPTSLYVAPDLKVQAVYPGFPSGEGKAAVAELIEKALGIWVAPPSAEKPGSARYVPKAGAGQRFRLGRLLFERNQKRKSVEEFQNAVKADPDYALAYAAGAFVAEEAGNAQVRDSLLEALKQRSSEPLFQESLGAALTAMGRLEGARQTLEALLSLEEPMPRALVALSYVRHRAGDRDGARQVLDKLKAWPKAGQTVEVDVGPYLPGDISPEEYWQKPVPFVLKLLDLSTPLGFGLKEGAGGSGAPKEPAKGPP